MPSVDVVCIDVTAEGHVQEVQSLTSRFLQEDRVTFADGLTQLLQKFETLGRILVGV